MTKIAIITGSTRPGRFNIQPAEWIYALAQQRKDIEVELLDLEKINLPFLDESTPAKMKKYDQPHTQAWSKKIDSMDGFVFVTPEYNHSYSPVLKNAIDYIYHEWTYKPVAFVSYGSLAGGSRAVEHLRAVAAELCMYDLREQVMLPNYWENMADGKYAFTEQHASTANHLLDSLIFWATAMKPAREQLAKLAH